MPTLIEKMKIKIIKNKIKWKTLFQWVIVKVDGIRISPFAKPPLPTNELMDLGIRTQIRKETTQTSLAKGIEPDQPSGSSL